MDAFKILIQNLPRIEAALGYTFSNKELLTTAFIHKSFINEHREITFCNERLEFVGDSVLGLIIAEFLYERFPDQPEGNLSSLRSRLVEATSCVSYVEALGISQFIALGKGEKFNAGRGRQTILADLLEAIVGAIYLDSHFGEAKKFILNNFKHQIDEKLTATSKNWKAILQDICQKQFQETPAYVVLSTFGPEHSKNFEVGVKVKETILGTGKGSSKKEAQQEAAEKALVNHFPDWRIFLECH